MAKVIYNKAAAAALKTAVKKDKTDFQAWYFLGLAQIRLEKLKDATKSLENASKTSTRLQRRPSCSWLYALFETNMTKQFVKLDWFLIRSQELPEAHHVIGAVSLRTDYREEALKESEIAINLSPAVRSLRLLAKSQAQVSFVSFAPVADQMNAY